MLFLFYYKYVIFDKLFFSFFSVNDAIKVITIQNTTILNILVSSYL